MDLQTLIRYINAANAANLRGDYAEAQSHCWRVLKTHPEVVEAWYNQGIAKRGMGRRAEAIECQKKVAALSANSADAQNACGLEFIELEAYREAEQCLNRVLILSPNHTSGLSNKAYLLQRQKRFDEAEPLIRRAIALKPDFATFHANLGAILNKRMMYGAAERVLEKALELDPGIAEAWSNLANARSGQRKFSEAETACRQAIALKPSLLDAWSNFGDILRETRQYSEAAEAYAHLLARSPSFDFVKGRLLYSLMQCCDWRRYEELRDAINKGLSNDQKVADPFGFQAVAESTADLLKCARLLAQEFFPERCPKKACEAYWPRHDKIRIGYLSGEFRTQATAILMAGLYERHNKSNFTITAFDNGENDHSELRARIENAFDDIVDIAGLTDEEAARAIEHREIDILVNLNGYFGKGRQGVFSLRPSPIQINYLGFPGTLGADYIDYLIADDTVIPEEKYGDYAEKIVCLPDCYQANDNQRPRPYLIGSRTEAGLPDEAFVYCCFNNSYKITPACFSRWIRILKQVDCSVLWLLEDNATAKANLQREAAAQGIDPTRLIFARRAPPEAHLARHALADLFLDSLPYNAHTTASDALWTGLPVLTRIGDTFPGRVAASLLKAIGLPELITRTDADYELLAVELANNLDKLHAIRNRLDQNRLRTPLFDTERFTRHIEAAFSTMYERLHAGASPDHFHVSR